MGKKADAGGGERVVRRRLDPDQSKEMILDATERLMQRDGYAAVSSRRVAIEAGLKPSLVHYYYRTTDDLLLAYYRRTVVRGTSLLEAALASPKPLRALWDIATDPTRTAMAAEFIALASHRKSVADDMAKNVAATRHLYARALTRAMSGPGISGMAIAPEVAATLFAFASYGVVLEGQLKADTNHAATRAFIEGLIESLER